MQIHLSGSLAEQAAGVRPAGGAPAQALSRTQVRVNQRQIRNAAPAHFHNRVSLCI